MWRRHGPLRRFHVRPDIPACCGSPTILGFKLKLDDVTYYVGPIKPLIPATTQGLPHLVEPPVRLSTERNSMHVEWGMTFHCPRTSVVELAGRIHLKRQDSTWNGVNNRSCSRDRYARNPPEVGGA